MCVERLIAATVIGLLALATKAETFTLIKAPVTAADWTDGAFYDGGQAPSGSSSDVIVTSVPKRLDISIDGASADFPAVTNFLSSISTFHFCGATIRINVPAGQTLTLTRPFYSSVTIDAEIGVVYKTGAGELVLDSCRLLNPSSTSPTDHQGDWRVMEGTLRIQPHAPNDVGYWWMMDYNYVAAGAKIVVPATGDKGAWQILQLEGEGLVTNESTIVSRIYKNASRRKELPIFSGVLGADIQLQVRSCSMDIQGVSNRGTITAGVSNERTLRGTPYLRKLGNGADSESSMGPGNATLPQRFVYTGLGETCDRSLYLHYLDTFMSGGTNGNLRLTGTASHWSTEQRNDALVLAGDNLHPCWLESAINRWSTDGNTRFWDVYIAKEGRGQWNLEHKYSTTAATVAIKDGVLGCSLLGRRGEVSSIGTSTNCHECAEQYDDANAVDYAIMLGDAANACATGLLENTSADAMMMERRSFALAGCGGFRQNANEGVVKYANVKGLGSGAKTLVLDGTSPKTNQVYDVADGEGVVSVLKRGPGTWLLGGDLTFSGDLTVEGGTLIVKRFPEDKYGYYRLSVCEIADYNADYYETPWGEATVDMVQVGLWAADTTRQNMNLTLVRQGELRPGTVAMAWNRTVSGADGGVVHGFNLLELLFAGCRAPYVKGPGETAESRLWNLFRRGFVPPGATSAARGPQRNVPDSWLNLDMCLAEGAQPVTLFDVACSGDGNSAPYFVHSWVTAVKLLGSVDGVHWEDLSDIQNGVKPTGGYQWISTGRSSYEGGGGCTVEDHFDASDPAVDWRRDPALPVYKRTNGGGFAATNTVPLRKFDVLTQVGTVKVSGGATLKFEGEGAPAITRLAVDPASGGTLDGFSLAASGTLNVLADDFAGQALTLPLSFSHVDTSAFANWSLQMNGVAKSKTPRFHCRNGVLTIYKVGCSIYLR